MVSVTNVSVQVVARTECLTQLSNCRLWPMMR